jgi:hypothetical protein
MSNNRSATANKQARSRRENRSGKLTAEKVRQMRSEWAVTPHPNANQFGKKYGVSISTIKAAVSGKTWNI